MFVVLFVRRQIVFTRKKIALAAWSLFQTALRFIFIDAESILGYWALCFDNGPISF